MANISRAALPTQLFSAVRFHAPLRRLHSSPLRAAVAHPVTAHGPPPKAPAPAPGFKEKSTQSKEPAPAPTDDASSRPTRASVSLKKRFWKDVHIHGKQGMCFEIYTKA